MAPKSDVIRQARGGPGKQRKVNPWLCVLGHTNLDLHVQVKDLPIAGQSSPVLERATAWGGTANTIARHAASLGVPTRLWSRVGDGFPAEWRRAMEAEGIDLSHFEQRTSARMPSCVVVTDTLGRQAYLMDQGAMASLELEPVPADVAGGLAEDGWLHIATGSPLGYALAADAAKRHGLSIALDPGQELRFQYDARSLEGLARYAQCLFVNEMELEAACTMLEASGPEDLLQLVETVVVTRGAKGASLYRAHAKPVHQRAFAVPLVDPTGAGDALRAGWYAALRAGHDPETALRWGQAAAATSIQHAGAQDHLLAPPDLRRLVGDA